MVQRNNIHKRKDGRREQRYKNGFRENRSIKCRSVYASSCAECEKGLVSVYADEKTPSEIRDDSKCFCDILDAWICTNRIRIKGATEAKYVRLIETHISPELGALKLHELNAGVINRFLDAKTHAGGLHNGAPLSASYVRTMAVIIEAALRYASAEGWCPPLKSPIYKPAVSKKAVDILSKNAAATLVKQLSDDLSPTAIGIFLALCGGLRIGEVCALQWQDVDFAANLIHVRHTVSRVPGHHTAQKTQLVLGAPKTASSLRDIPIPSLLRNALLKVYQNRCSSFVISSSNSFVSTRTFDYQYRRWLKKHNIPVFKFHTLRHTYATHCAESGMDAKTLSQLLGHSSSTISLNVYVHPSLDAAASLLEQMYCTS